MILIDVVRTTTQGVIKINPFSEDLSIREELREAWKKIEHLEKEKIQLNNENRDLQIENKRLNDFTRYLQEQVDFYESQEMLDEERREGEG